MSHIHSVQYQLVCNIIVNTTEYVDREMVYVRRKELGQATYKGVGGGTQGCEDLFEIVSLPKIISHLHLITGITH